MLFKDVHVMDPVSGLDAIKDVLVNKGRIERIDDSIEAPGEVIDGSGCILAPSFFDTHVHFRDFGESEKDTFETGAMAALKGGYTTCVAMANTKPPLDRVERIEEAKEKIRKLPLEILLSANITMDMKGKELTDFEALLDAGVVGFTDDGLPLESMNIMEEALRLSAKYDVPLSLHEEDPKYIEHAGYNHSAPREAEISIIQRDIEMHKRVGGRMNVQHLTSKEGVELIRQGKKECPGLTCEVTPNHLFFTEEDVETYGTLLKVNPPLRTEEDRQALIEGLKDGTIDFIATDHAPHTKENKSRGTYASMSGILSLETVFSMAVMKLLDPGHLTMMEILEKLSTNPRKLYKRVQPIAVGERADLVLLDPNQTYKYSFTVSKSENTPLLGQELKGLVRMTMAGGKVLYNNMKGTWK
ncbi:MAG: dihydroorotase [Tissierellia bacterium]|nr:dihydroorotase [Tissierellia bacterium]